MDPPQIKTEIAALLAEVPSSPKHDVEGIPLNEMKVPTSSVLPPYLSSFKPAIVKRCEINPQPLLTLLEKEGNNGAWDPAVQEASNVPFDRPAHDKWGVGKIMFIHCDDFMKRCYHMPWWHEIPQWRDVIEPYFQALNVPTNRIVRCLLAKLPPGVIIPVHHDTGHWVPNTHRLHVPIITNKDVIFRAGLTEPVMQRYQLEVGNIYELNNQSKHYVSNWGDNCRVHLIFDYVDTDTLVPPLEILDRGEAVLQTRRSIDRVKHAGSRPVGPAFIILGAQKSGTTALYEYLHQHPLVMQGCRRESHAFDWRWEDKAKTLEEKRRFCINRFFNAKKLHSHPSIMCGDSTPSYLLHSNIVLPRLKEVVPWSQLIVCLRDPVLRAYSHYQMVVDPEGTPAQLNTRGRSHWAGKSFAQVVDAELAVLEELGITPNTSYEDFASRYLANPKFCPLGHGGHSLVARGLYALQLEPWLKLYPLVLSTKNAQNTVSHKGALEDESKGIVGKTRQVKEETSHMLKTTALSASEVIEPILQLKSPKLMVVKLEDLHQETSTVMESVFKHVGLEPIALVDEAPKNARNYPPLNESCLHSTEEEGHYCSISSGDGVSSNEKAAARLRAFYRGHNSRLDVLLESPDFTRAWMPKSPTH